MCVFMCMCAGVCVLVILSCGITSTSRMIVVTKALVLFENNLTMFFYKYVS